MAHVSPTDFTDTCGQSRGQSQESTRGAVSVRFLRVFVELGRRSTWRYRFSAKPRKGRMVLAVDLLIGTAAAVHDKSCARHGSERFCVRNTAVRCVDSAENAHICDPGTSVKIDISTHQISQEQMSMSRPIPFENFYHFTIFPVYNTVRSTGTIPRPFHVFRKKKDLRLHDGVEPLDCVRGPSLSR